MMPVKAMSRADGAPYFTENFMPAGGGAVFTFTPASCTLLFPYGAVVSAADWNTGIAISNPSAFTNTPLSGAITFTLFPNDEEMIVHSTDGMSSGTGLAEDGSLPAGNTHTVLLSEVLADAGMPGDFIGHLYVRDQLHRLQRRGLDNELDDRQPGLSPLLRRQPRRRGCPCQQCCATPSRRKSI